MSNFTKNPCRLVYLMVFQLVDIVTTTLIYSHGGLDMYDSFITKFMYFNMYSSLCELWLFGLMRTMLIFGAVFGFICSTKGKIAINRIKSVDLIVLIIGALQWSYTLVKMLIYTNIPLSTQEIPWFWSLFSWSIISSILLYVNWSVLSKSRPHNKGRKFKPNLRSKCTINSTTDEQENLLEGNVSGEDGESDMEKSDSESSSSEDSDNENENSESQRKKKKKRDAKEEDEAEIEKLNSTRDKAGTIWRLLSFSRPDLRYILLAFFFMVLCCAAETGTPYFTGAVLQGIAIDRDLHKFYRAILYMSLLSAASAVCSGLRAWFFKIAMSRLDIRIRKQLFTAIVKQEVGFFDKVKTGAISSRLQSDTAIMSSTLGFNVNVFARSILNISAISSRLQSDTAIMSSTLGLNVNVFARSILNIIGIVFFMLKISWRLSVLSLIGLPVITGFSKIYGAFYEKLSEKVQAAFAEGSEVAEQAFSSIRTVRSFASETTETGRYNSKLAEVYALNLKEAAAYAVYMWGNSVFSLSLTIAILYYGGCLVFENKISGGDMVSFLLYQIQLGGCIQSIGYVYTGLMQAVGASHKVFSYMFREPKVPNDGKLKPPHLHGKLEFKNVTFAYPSRPDTNVLEDVSFTVEPGEVVALVGPSGGGKSTCVSLLEHFYETKAGEVLLDGEPVNKYDHKYLHKKISLVGQEPTLFACTISENISYGLDDELDLISVQEAAEMSNAHSFISEMTDKYETEAGEKGIQLSGGQKQRIAIARAIIRKPTVLILDEATSALDSESEHLVQEAIYNNLKHRTVIIIAHRLSTVEKATRIIVINKGRVVEQGTHVELLQNGGMYTRLVKRQLLAFNTISINDGDHADSSSKPGDVVKTCKNCNSQDVNDNTRSRLSRRNIENPRISDKLHVLGIRSGQEPNNVSLNLDIPLNTNLIQFGTPIYGSAP